MAPAHDTHTHKSTHIRWVRESLTLGAAMAIMCQKAIRWCKLLAFFYHFFFERPSVTFVSAFFVVVIALVVVDLATSTYLSALAVGGKQVRVRRNVVRASP